MNKDSLNLKNLPASIDSLETTAEGQLRGGFAVMGGGTDSPMRANGLCVNTCNNDKCTGAVGTNKCHNTECDSTTNNSVCSNSGCVNKPSSKTNSSVPSLGITALF